MMNNKQDIIYDKCLNTLNCDFANEIDDLIEKIIDEQRNNHILQMRDIKQEYDNKINKYLSELEKEKEQVETLRIMRRSKQWRNWQSSTIFK